jgi:chromosome segregation ATPase
VSLAVILIFRQFDKRESPVEKLKRFADKNKSDLDEKFTGQMRTLSNASVDLATKQDLAAAAVRRFNQQYQEFKVLSDQVQAKREELEVVKKNLDQYGTEFSSLMEMTANVEENLERIKKEAGIVDALNKRLDTQQKKVGFMEAKIPELEADFTRRSEENLKTVQIELEEQFGALQTDLTERITGEAARLENSLAVVLDKNESLIQEINDKIAAAYENATERTSVIEDTAFAKLEKQAAERLEAGRAEFEARCWETAKNTEEQLSVIPDRVDGQIASIQATLDTAQTEVSEAMEKLRMETDNNNKVLHSLEEQVRNFAEDVKENFVALYEEGLAEAKQNAKSAVEEYHARSAADAKNLEYELMQRIQEARANLADELKKTQEAAQNTKANLESELANNRALVETMRSNLETQLEQIRLSAGEKQSEVRTVFFEELQTLRDELELRLDKVRQTAAKLELISGEDEERMRQYEQKIKVQTGVLDEFLSAEQQRISEVTAQIENQIDRYQGDIDYRLQRLASMDIDVDRLEVGLREALSLAENRVTEDFAAFAGEQQTQQEEFRAGMNKSAGEIAENLAQLEKALEELKQRAYADVAAKFKDFEGEFLVDLSRRGDEITDELIRWKKSFDSRLIALGIEYEDQRRALETAKGEELKIRLSAFEEILGESLNEKLSRFEQEIQQKLAGITEAVSSDQTKTQAVIEDMLSDISVWKERLSGQFDESRNVFNAKLESLDKNASDAISQIESRFKNDVASYSESVSVERANIVTELEALKTEAHQAIAEYQEHSNNVLEEVQGMYGRMLEDTNRRIREQSVDCGQQLQDMKTLAQEIRERDAAAQEQMTLKLEQETVNLTKAFDGLDKRFKDFAAQSNSIEKAHSDIISKAEDAKTQLEGAIVNMRTEITNIRAGLTQTEAFRPLLTELRQEYTKMQDMELNASRKLAKFSGEKKRIENLEADFNHLMALSAKVTDKAAGLQNTDDVIQRFEAEIRKFNDELNALDTRHERLAKQNEVVDQTRLGVDRSFEKLKELEKRLSEYQQQAELLPGKLEGVMQDMGRVMSSRERIDEALKKLNIIERTLNDTEIQTEKIDKTRDMIARTEARLQELSKNADDQVRLFQSLVNANTAKVPVSGGVSIKDRENVRELSHRGWTREQIATALKLTVTEVDLILDLPG